MLGPQPIPAPFPNWKLRPQKEIAALKEGRASSVQHLIPCRVVKRARIWPSLPGCRAEEVVQQKWVERWMVSLLPLVDSSPTLSLLGELAEASLSKLLAQKEGSTLKKRWSGWQLWCEYVAAQNLQPQNAGLKALVAFFQALAEIKRSGAEVLRGLKLAGSFMGWSSFLEELDNAAVSAWCVTNVRAARKEALPLALCTVANLEKAVHTDMACGGSSDLPFLTFFLLLLWGCLRFSDGQRVMVNELVSEFGLVRGSCWKTKTSRSSMPFGVLLLGIFNDWSGAVQSLQEQLADLDFLLRSASGDRASYTYALGHFRRLLVQRGGVPAEYVQMYTLHSLKVTPLSWALQLNIDKESRRLWGHHRCRESGAAMASKYSRDDVLPALRAQLAVLQAIRNGWVPLTPQARGGQRPLVEKGLSCGLAPLKTVPLGLAPYVEGGTGCSAASQGSDTDSSSESSRSSSDEDCCDAAAAEASVHSDLVVVNRWTGCVHAAVQLPSGGVGRACAPLWKVAAPRWEVCDSEPDGCFYCSHRACASVLGLESSDEV